MCRGRFEDGRLIVGGTYDIDIEVPNDYPFKPPKMRFITKVYHPNISSQTVLSLPQIAILFEPFPQYLLNSSFDLVSESTA